MASNPTVCAHVQRFKSIAYSFTLILFSTQIVFAERPFHTICFNPSPSLFSLTLVCPPSITVGITGNACAATIQLPQLQVVSSSCNGSVTTQISSPLGNGYGPFYNTPLGSYLIDCKAFNTCGDTSYCTYMVYVRDTKKPFAVVKSALYSNITADGTVKIRARLLNQNSNDNCTNSSSLKYSYSANIADSVRVFNCNQLGTHPVTITVHDESGNKTNGLSQIIVQDGMGYCQNVAVAANATTTSGAIVNNICYKLTTSTFEETLVSETGQLLYDEVQMGENCTIKPSKNDNWLNGLNVYDLKLLQNHLSGITLLNTPLKLIAADINRSGSVTSTDLQLLRSLILGDITTINQNTSWRFLPKNQIFPNPTNPFATAFAEQINLNNLSLGNNLALFSGIKIGDLNGSAALNIGTNNQTNFRKNNPFFLLITEDQAFKTGDIVQISLTVDPTMKDITDFQLTLDFNMNNLSFQSASTPSYANIGFGNVGLAHANEGAITLLNERAPAENGAENQIFHATFKALTDGNLSESLHISDRITPSAAFDKDGNRHNISLNFVENPITEGKMQLFSNFPNPFIEMTLLRFSLPEKDDVTINIFDGQGKTIYNHVNNFEKGEQQVLLQRSDIGEAGIYVYQVISKYGTATRKLIMF
jgi:Secretion system C-terminal sorting domain